MATHDPRLKETIPPTGELAPEGFDPILEDPTLMRDTEEHHATTSGSAFAGAVTGGMIGTAAGPLGTAVGAVGGAIVGAITERVMHHDNPDRELYGEDSTVPTEEERILGDDAPYGERGGLDERVAASATGIDGAHREDSAGVAEHRHTFVAGYCTCGARQP
jgi:hypothetical protein